MFSGKDVQPFPNCLARLLVPVGWELTICGGEVEVVGGDHR